MVILLLSHLYFIIKLYIDKLLYLNFESNFLVIVFCINMLKLFFYRPDCFENFTNLLFCIYKNNN